MSENELTPEEKNAFEALPREREPGRLLEERTVATLRERGRLRPRTRASRILRTGAAAAVAAVFLSGFAAGRLTAPDGALMDGASAGIDTQDSTSGARLSAEGERLEPSRIVWL